MTLITRTRVRIHRWIRTTRQHHTDIAFERLASATEMAELTATV